jgi:transposase
VAYSRPGGAALSLTSKWDAARKGREISLKTMKAFLQADGCSAYDEVGGVKVICAGCWSHARRKFFQALQVDPQEKRALELVATIDELFSIEARAREGGFEVEQRLVLRQAEAGPWLEKIKTLVLEARKAALPCSRLAEGCDYLLKRWKQLTRFLQHCSLEISTNLAENAIRPIALGRNYEQSGIRQSLTRAEGDFLRWVLDMADGCNTSYLGIIRDYRESLIDRLAV